MRTLFLLLLLISLCGAAPGPVRSGPIELFVPSEGMTSAGPVELRDFALEGEETWLMRRVEVDPKAMPLAVPLMVEIVALASSEVSWNGVPIGRNGRPGPDRASETAGRFIATMPVPPELIRPGQNILMVRLSSHHLWLPVRTPVHSIRVISYRDSPGPAGLLHYLPALLVLGAFLVSLLYFTMAALSDRTDRPARLLAAISGIAALQLLVEVARAVFAYTYPWHLARVTAIALLAAVTACLVAFYAVHRFAPNWRWLGPATAALAALGLVLLPWFDFKAIAAILAGALALGLASARAARDGRRDAMAGIAAALAFPLAAAWEGPGFLDQAYYLLLAFLLALLVAEQVILMRRTRLERDRERKRASELALRLAHAEQAGEPIIALKDGHRVHRVAERDIVWIRAADDYCDVLLTDGRTLLATTSLSKLLQTLPDRFVRIHRSFAVNRAHVVSSSPRPGGGRQLELSDGSEIPVGRAYREKVMAWAG